jgi:hypothetical protein
MTIIKITDKTDVDFDQQFEADIALDHETNQIGYWTEFGCRGNERYFSISQVAVLRDDSV